MRPRSLPDVLLVLSTVITAASGVLLAITNLNDTLRHARESLLSLPTNLAWALAAVLGGLALAAGTAATLQRSRLTRRNAFKLRPDRVEHLHGRDDDIERLARLLQDYPQVNIIGESGAGKSALIRSGVMPRLLSSQFIVIYVDTLGHDWIQGPESATLTALAANDILDGAPTVSDAAASATRLGRRLLLIFDQFDDYQSNHIDHFVTSQSHTFLARADLLSTNPFWREIDTLVRSNLIHCAFVTRNDSAAGLECVRFTEPRVYLLDRLRVSAADDLIDFLTQGSEGAPPVIDAPGKGWTTLRHRLVSDLSADGSVLPAQMAVALAGLATLRFLTVREYQKRGGLHGLEAAEIEWRIANTAHRGDMTSSQALSLFLTLIDRESRKTRARTFDEIVAFNPTISPETIRAILQEWESKELVRRRADADTGNAVWLLDHDYLCKAVLAAEARMNASWITLRDAAADFEASGYGVVRRWRTLLAPSQQIAMWRHRLLGRLRFATHRRYIALSSVRFLPYIAIAGILAVTAYQRHVLKYERAAEALLQDLTMTSDTPAADTLWALAEAPPETKLYFVRSTLRSMTAAKTIQPQVGTALRAIVGADHEMRERIRVLLRSYALSRWQTAPVRVAAIRGLHEIGGIDRDVMLKALEFDETEDILAGRQPAVDESDWVRVVRVETSERLAPITEKLLERLADAETESDLSEELNQRVSRRDAVRKAVVVLQEKTNVADALVSRVADSTSLTEALRRTAIVTDLHLSPVDRRQVAQQLLTLLPDADNNREVLECIFLASLFDEIAVPDASRPQVERAMYESLESDVPCTWTVVAAKVLSTRMHSSADAARLFAFLNGRNRRCPDENFDIISTALLRYMNPQDYAIAVRQLKPSAETEKPIYTEPAVVMSYEEEEGMGRPDRIRALAATINYLRERGLRSTVREKQLAELLTSCVNDRKTDVALVDYVIAATALQRPLPVETTNRIRAECRRALINPDAKSLVHIFDVLVDVSRRTATPRGPAPEIARVVRETLLAGLRSLPQQAAVSLATDFLEEDLGGDNVEVLLQAVCSSVKRKNFWPDQFMRELQMAQSDAAAARVAVALLSSQQPLQTYVDVFRTPTCGSKCRSIVIRRAEQRTNRKFADDWVFVEWIATQQLTVQGPSPQRGNLFASG